MKSRSKTKKRWIIRNASFADALQIFRMIKKHPNELVPRPISDILENIDRFLVCDLGGKIIGTASWGILPEIGSAKDPTVEIKSVSVDRYYRRHGIGKALIEAAIERVKLLRPEQILVLTFKPAFFGLFGFKQVPKETIMHKLYTGCMNCTRYDSPFTCPEVAMSLVING